MSNQLSKVVSLFKSMREIMILTVTRRERIFDNEPEV